MIQKAARKGALWLELLLLERFVEADGEECRPGIRLALGVRHHADRPKRRRLLQGRARRRAPEAPSLFLCLLTADRAVQRRSRRSRFLSVVRAAGPLTPPSPSLPPHSRPPGGTNTDPLHGTSCIGRVPPPRPATIRRTCSNSSSLTVWPSAG